MRMIRPSGLTGILDQPAAIPGFAGKGPVGVDPAALAKFLMRTTLASHLVDRRARAPGLVVMHRQQPAAELAVAALAHRLGPGAAFGAQDLERLRGCIDVNGFCHRDCLTRSINSASSRCAFVNACNACQNLTMQ